MSSDPHALPGSPPPAPPWGQQPLPASLELCRRIAEDPARNGQVAVVLGAGGAFAPDLLWALKLGGFGAVVGADVQLTYPVDGVVYREVDLRDADAVRAFFDAVAAWAEAGGRTLGPVFDLSAVQTNPTGGGSRAAMGAGKQALIDWLCEQEGDRSLFYMSTAEVYGAPEGAPYDEPSTKAPFNAYARRKWAEEQEVMAHHGRATASGTLRICALRTWTIAMVLTDGEGTILEARNYNDPLIVVAERLARAGFRVPVVDPELLCVFHPSEEVAEAALLLGTASVDAPTWGRPFNCVGKPATHGELTRVCYEVFAGKPVSKSALRLPRRLLVGLAHGLERAGGWLGARDMAARLPFLFRSTHLDTGALEQALGDQLTEPSGSETTLAVRRLCEGIRAGGPDALNLRRYRMY